MEIPNLDCIHLTSGRCGALVNVGGICHPECSNDLKCHYYIRDMRLTNLEETIRRVVREELEAFNDTRIL
jgi:hypothetical protein